MSRCMVVGCERDALTHSMCRQHFDRWRRTGDARKRRMSRACIVCGRFFETDRRDRAFCSDKCRKRFNYLQRTSPHPPSREPNPLRAVAWEDYEELRDEPKKAVPRKIFTIAQVWAKSKTCPVCGEVLDRSADVLSDEGCVPSWTVPLDEGGEATLSNRIIVHRRCKARQALSARARQGWKARRSHGRKRKKS